MYLTESELSYIYNFLLQEEEEIKRTLPKELTDQFKAELSSAFSTAKMQPMLSKHGSVFLASVNPQYGAARGQGKFRVTQLAHNTPEFWSSLSDNEKKSMEGVKDSPMIPLFHSSFTFPEDAVKTIKHLSSLSDDLHPTKATVELWKHDQSDMHNLEHDPATRLKETVEGFLNDLNESFTRDFAEPFPLHMPYKKLKKIASAMAGATSAGTP